MKTYIKGLLVKAIQFDETSIDEIIKLSPNISKTKIINNSTGKTTIYLTMPTKTGVIDKRCNYGDYVIINILDGSVKFVEKSSFEKNFKEVNESKILENLNKTSVSTT